MKRLINSRSRSLATVVSNLVFNFIKKNISMNTKMFKVANGIGFAWINKTHTYEIRITAKKIEVEKKLPGGTIKHVESRFSEGLTLIKDTLKEIEKIF